ncbi:MAG: hypothetical protein U9Q05_13075 [Thermodesulfobacteriota bacterium]|nr:hypothetical protein [Thermodesulfobacteriota bacterium]
MTVKFDHYWTVNPRKRDDYEKFIIKQFIPGVNRLNMHAVAAWSVMVGAYSDFILETVSKDLDLLEEALRSDKYRKLISDLQLHITNYKTKVWISTGKKDAYSTDIREDTIKFNQMWNVTTESKEDYDEYSRYVMEEFYPMLEDLGILVAGEWEVLIGDGPRLFCEGRVNDVQSLIVNLQGAQFRKGKKKLKNYIDQYQSRILAFHIRKVKGYKSASYEIVRG